MDLCVWVSEDHEDGVGAGEYYSTVRYTVVNRSRRICSRKVKDRTTYKTRPSSTGPLTLDSVTTNHLFNPEKKMEKGWKKLSIVKYIGRSGIWIHDSVRHNSIHGIGTEIIHVLVWARYGTHGGNCDTNDKSIWEGQISGRVTDVTEILMLLTTVKDVMVSMNTDWWDWTG